MADVRVVDLTDAYGAYSSRLLQDLGAEVVRVEPPGGGAGRSRPPRSADGTSLHHVQRNAGKVIVRTADPAVVDDLLAGADIAFCSESDSAAELTQRSQRHPHLIVVSVTPFGVAGPTAGWHATELVTQALAHLGY